MTYLRSSHGQAGTASDPPPSSTRPRTAIPRCRRAGRAGPPTPTTGLPATDWNMGGDRTRGHTCPLPRSHGSTERPTYQAETNPKNGRDETKAANRRPPKTAATQRPFALRCRAIWPRPHRMGRHTRPELRPHVDCGGSHTNSRRRDRPEGQQSHRPAPPEPDQPHEPVAPANSRN